MSSTTTDINWKYVKAKFEEINKQHPYTQPPTNYGTCPNCGYCPHCGRGGHYTYPYQPWNPYPWYGPTYVTCEITK